MTKPIVLGGYDAIFHRHTFRSYMGRDVVHAMRDYPNELEKLCGGLLVDGYDRSPASCPDMNFKLCRSCFNVSVNERAAKSRAERLSTTKGAA